MTALGYILLAFGLMAALIGDAMFLAAAFKRGLWWLLGCLLVPMVDVVVLLLNWKAAAKPFAVAVLGLLVAGVGAEMAGVSWPELDETPAQGMRGA